MGENAPIQGTIIWIGEGLADVLLDDQQIVSEPISSVRLWVEAHRTNLFSAPLPPPTSTGFPSDIVEPQLDVDIFGPISPEPFHVPQPVEDGHTTHHERLLAIAEEHDRSDEGVEEVKGGVDMEESRAERARGQAEAKAKDPFLAPVKAKAKAPVKSKAKASTVPQAKPKSKKVTYIHLPDQLHTMLETDYDPKFEYGKYLPVVENSRDYAVGDVVELPPFFWSNDYKDHRKTLATVVSFENVVRTDSTKLAKKKQRKVPHVLLQSVHQEGDELFDPYLTPLRELKRFARTLSTDENNKVLGEATVSSVVGDAMEIDGVSCSAVEGEVYSFVGELDSTQYSHHEMHADCKHMFCSTRSSRVRSHCVDCDSEFHGATNPKGGGTVVSAVALAIDGFIQSLSPEARDNIKYDTTPEPVSEKEAAAHKYADDWADASREEFSRLDKMGVFHICSPSEIQELKRTHVKILTTRQVYKIKRRADGSLDKFKARLVVRGFTQRPGACLSAAETFVWYQASRSRFLQLSNEDSRGIRLRSVYCRPLSVYLRP